MQKILAALGIVFLVLIIVGVVGFSVIATKGAALDKESKAYVDQVTPLILADLNKETLFKYADDRLKSSAKPEDFEKIFAMFARLGAFKAYQGSTGQANVMITGKGKQISGQYNARAEFASGPATVAVTVVKTGADWKVLGFKINSMALVE